MMPLDPRAMALLAVGVGSVTIGGVTLVGFEWIVRRFSYETLAIIEVLGQLVLYGVLIGSIYLMYRYGKLRITTPTSEASLPSVARPTPVRRPGDGLGARFDAIEDRSDEAYRAVTSRLRALVRAELADTDRDPIESGSWTDDTHAAAELADSIDRPRWSLRTVGTLLDPTGAPVRRAIGRTIREVIRSIAPETAGPRRVRDRPPTVADATPADPESGPTQRITGRWTGVAALALLGILLGVVYREPSLFVVAAVGIGFAAYARSGSPPSQPISVFRTIEAHDPGATEPVTVTVTVRNRGSEAVSDCRIVDGVPGPLRVRDGSPAIATRLASGDTVSWEYTIAPRRGHHRFNPARVILRSLPGNVEVEQTEPVSGDDNIRWPMQVDRAVEDDGRHPPVHADIGETGVTTPGRGIEFHSSKRYEPGDPPACIDWHRYARTGIRSTIRYRTDRERPLLLVIDARSAAYTAPARRPDRHAVDRSCEIAAGITMAGLAAGRPVGLTAVHPEPCWVAPGAGPKHRNRILETLSTHPSLGADPPADSAGVDHILRNVSLERTEIVVVTPLADHACLALLNRLQTRIRSMRVLTVDPTHAETGVGMIARLERHHRILSLREGGVSVDERSWQMASDEQGDSPT